MHVRLRGPKSWLTLYQIINKPWFPSLADEIAEPRLGMNIKVAAFTVSEKSSNILKTTTDSKDPDEMQHNAHFVLKGVTCRIFKIMIFYAINILFDTICIHTLLVTIKQDSQKERKTS